MERIKELTSKLDEWDLYNCFFMMSDIERVRKFLVREYLFKMSLELPGDIVEVGVFKGIGFSQLLKLREIFTPASNKKVIGFDLFSSSLNFKKGLNDNDKKLDEFYLDGNVNMEVGIKKEEITNFLDNIKLTNKNYELIEGDVKLTISEYLEKNPGFRISYLYLDLDIEEPTLISLNLLYDRVVRGGIIVLDEYACHKWTESKAVDKFLESHKDLQLKTIPWGRTPTAYLVKS